MSQEAIGFLISSLNSGGAERVVSLLANELVKKKKVTIITLNKDKPFYDIDKRISLIQLGVFNKSKNKFKALISNIILIYRIRKNIINNKIGHLICFMPTSNVLGIISGKFLSKTKVTISERSNPNFNLNFSIAFSILRTKLYRFADRLVVQTPSIKDYFSQYVDHKKISIIDNPIMLEKKHKKRKENIILTVGRADINKNQELILRSFSRIKSDEWKLFICGDGPELKKLKSLAIKLNVGDRVRFWGKVKNVEDFYKRASVFAFGSLSEGFPNVLLEAMNHHCACISTDCPTGPNELINHNENGFLIPIGDQGYYDKCLQRLINDEELRIIFSTKSKEKIKKHSLSDIAVKWVQ